MNKKKGKTWSKIESQIFQKIEKGVGKREIFEELYTEKDPWSSRGSYIEKKRFDILINLIENMDKKYRKYGIILDIGCGEGIFTHKLKKFWKNIIGIDISVRAINRAINEFDNNITFLVGDIGYLPFKDAHFSLVTCLEVLCYLKQDERVSAINELDRITTKGGIVLISGVIRGGEYFLFDDLIELISQKFKILKIKPISAKTVRYVNRKIPYRYWYWLFLLLARLFPKSFASQIAVLATKD